MIETLKSLARLTGLPAEELETRLNEAGEDTAAETFMTLVMDKFKDEERRSKDNFYKKGEKEKARKVETALQPIFDEYGIAADTLESSAAQLAEKLKEQPGKPGGDGLTPDTIRTHTAYKQAFDADTEAIRRKLQAAETALQQAQAQEQRRAKLEKLRPVMLDTLRKKKASFGQGEEKALQAFFLLHPLEDFDVSDDGQVTVMKGGEPLKDEYLNPLNLETFLEKNWLFGFSADTPPPTPAPARQGQGGGGHRFADRAAYLKAYDDALTKGNKALASELEAAWIKQSEK
jgi:hypothetical protein